MTIMGDGPECKFAEVVEAVEVVHGGEPGKDSRGLYKCSDSRCAVRFKTKSLWR